ncbi:hypothetical protein OS493_033441 [Desmophyllum pertusum]|uniref:Uncharacterized protein n=1 Tax=Desmophyllum pertusum TaxID=174260 RepID=A0A9W9ZXT3_9CNID|nr:hypothetical protein OS493_033441 [Desmophyllum pertusum]
MKLSLVLLVTVLMGIEAKHTLNLHDCSEIRDTRCSEDSQCACLSHENSPRHFPLICNYRSKCWEESILDSIQRRLPCYRRIYKHYCLQDADCQCREARLICEDNECVRGEMRALFTD